MKKSLLLTAVAAALLLISCASNQPEELPVEMTKLEIVQQAQTAYDKGKTELAIHYYETLLKRYGMETAVYVEGKYEIAHIYVKEKKYSEAYPLIMEIKEIYETALPGELPASYRKLAEIDLTKFPEDFDPAKK